MASCGQPHVGNRSAHYGRTPAVSYPVNPLRKSSSTLSPNIPIILSPTPPHETLPHGRSRLCTGKSAVLLGEVGLLGQSEGVSFLRVRPGFDSCFTLERDHDFIYRP